MCNSEMDLGLEASKYKNPRFDIVSRIAYLLGVSEEYFLGEESNFDETIYTGLEECKDARIVRNLCIIRTALLRNNGRIRNLFQYDMKNIDTIPEYMLMCGKVTNDNLIDSSHYFRNTDQYEKLMWGFSYISFCLSKHFGESDVFVSFLLTASL